MDLATLLQGGGTVPGSGVPIQQGGFQSAMRNWMTQRPQDASGVQPWLAGRPDPHQYMAQGNGGLAAIMAQHPGRNWHPGMMRARQYQGGM